MGPKCTDCFYCRRGTIVTWEPAFTCLHPVARDMSSVGHLAELCPTMRSAEGACGPEGALFRPKTADGPQPIHMFRN
jgi:hypothetical protein